MGLFQLSSTLCADDHNSGSECAMMRWPNKSLERTAAESVFLCSEMLGGCRSALRWASLKAEDRVFQMHEIDRRDSNILAAQFRSLSSNVVHECRLIIPKSTFGD